MSLQGLAEKNKFLLLTQLVNNEITVKDFAVNAELLKKKRQVKAKLVQHLDDDVSCWEDAVAFYPDHTSEELSKLCKLKFTKTSLPKEFVEFCNDAKLVRKTASTTCEKELDPYTKIEGYDIYIVDNTNSIKEVVDDEEHCFFYCQLEKECGKRKLDIMKRIITINKNMRSAVFGSFEQLQELEKTCHSKSLCCERVFQYSMESASQEKTVFFVDCVRSGIVFYHKEEDMGEKDTVPNMWHLDQTKFLKKLINYLTEEDHVIFLYNLDQVDLVSDLLNRNRKMVFVNDKEMNVNDISNKIQEKLLQPNSSAISEKTPMEDTLSVRNEERLQDKESNGPYDFDEDELYNNIEKLPALNKKLMQNEKQDTLNNHFKINNRKRKMEDSE